MVIIWKSHSRIQPTRALVLEVCSPADSSCNTLEAYFKTRSVSVLYHTYYVNGKSMYIKLLRFLHAMPPL